MLDTKPRRLSVCRAADNHTGDAESRYVSDAVEILARQIGTALLRRSM